MHWKDTGTYSRGLNPLGATDREEINFRNHSMRTCTHAHVGFGHKNWLAGWLAGTGVSNICMQTVGRLGALFLSVFSIFISQSPSPPMRTP